MVPKIPSSLKWLIDKRARLDAEIKKTRASLASAKQLIDELSELENDLAAIDRSLGLHEIRVQIENIQPVRSHYVRVTAPWRADKVDIAVFAFTRGDPLEINPSAWVWKLKPLGRWEREKIARCPGQRGNGRQARWKIVRAIALAEKGCSKSMIASILEIHPSAISNWIRRDSFPDLGNALKSKKR